MMTASLPAAQPLRIAGITVPNLAQITALAIGGAAGMGIWEYWSVAPTTIVAGGPLEPPALIKALFNARLGIEPSDFFARTLHYLTGIIGYPVAYFLLTRNGISIGRPLDGWLWGLFTTFIALGIFAPLADLPFLLLAWGGQLTLMSTIGHTIYGAFAAYVAELVMDHWSVNKR